MASIQQGLVAAGLLAVAGVGAAAYNSGGTAVVGPSNPDIAGLAPPEVPPELDTEHDIHRAIRVVYPDGTPVNPPDAGTPDGG